MMRKWIPIELFPGFKSSTKEFGTVVCGVRKYENNDDVRCTLQMFHMEQHRYNDRVGDLEQEVKRLQKANAELAVRASRTEFR